MRAREKELDVDAILASPQFRAVNDESRKQAALMDRELQANGLRVSDVEEEENNWEAGAGTSSEAAKGTLAGGVKVAASKRMTQFLKQENLDFKVGEDKESVRARFQNFAAKEADPGSDQGEEDAPEFEVWEPPAEEETPPPLKSSKSPTPPKIDRTKQPVSAVKGVQEVYRAPPLPSEMQKILASMKEMSDKIAELEAGRVPLSNTLNLPAASVSFTAFEPNYLPVYLPSGGIFYDFSPDIVRIRKVNLESQMAITSAQTRGNRTDFINAVASCTHPSFDLRDLSYPDFESLLFTILFASYPRTPLQINWKSRYGNRNAYTIKSRDLKYRQPALSKAEYRELKSTYGLAIPSVREWEFFQNNPDLDSDSRSVALRAQYFSGRGIEQRIATMSAQCAEGIEALEAIPDFISRSDHAVLETVQVSDAKYNSDDHLEQLMGMIAALEATVEENPDVDNSSVVAEIAELQGELGILVEKKEKGGAVEPELEIVRIQLNPLAMFPSL